MIIETLLHKKKKLRTTICSNINNATSPWCFSIWSSGGTIERRTFLVKPTHGGRCRCVKHAAKFTRLFVSLPGFLVLRVDRVDLHVRANTRHRSPTRCNFPSRHARLVCNVRETRKKRERETTTTTTPCKIFHRPEFHKLPTGRPCPWTLIAIELHVEYIVRPVAQRKHPPASRCRRDGNVWEVSFVKNYTPSPIYPALG